MWAVSCFLVYRDNFCDDNREFNKYELYLLSFGKKMSIKKEGL